jgi:hypothetical protein
MADEIGGGPGEEHEGPLRPLNVVPLHQDPWLVSTWLLTHEAVVLELKRLHGADFVYVERLGEVFHWNGHVWELDERATLPNVVAELCRRIGATQKKKTARQKVESSSFIAGCVGRLRQELTAPVDRFDKAEVFNLRDATVSLKPNGSHAWHLRPQRREDYCTKIGGMTAVPGPCPMWLEFFFFYGSGGNGKGAFLRTLAAVLGDYASTASLDLFLASKFEQHPEELAGLRGARLVVATETGVGRRWDEQKIKAMSGGDKVRARFMRQNSFEYDPQFKIVVSGNDQPRIADTGPALRRRLQMVPFDIQVTPDGTFEARMLAAEGPGARRLCGLAGARIEPAARGAGRNRGVFSGARCGRAMAHRVLRHRRGQGRERRLHAGGKRGVACTWDIHRGAAPLLSQLVHEERLSRAQKNPVRAEDCGSVWHHRQESKGPRPGHPLGQQSWQRVRGHHVAGAGRR